MCYTYRIRTALLTAVVATAGLPLFAQAAPPPPAPRAATPALRVSVLAQSPAESTTDLQIICLFRSIPGNTLHGSLIETNDKLHGLLDQLRQPARFGGEFGETLLVIPPAGTLTVRNLLIIGLGDAATFTPDREYLVGKIAFREANRPGIAHPFFAPTVLDGGVTGFSTDLVAEQFVRGFRDGLATATLLQASHAAGAVAVQDLTFLAGAKNVPTTQKGIDHALTPADRRP